MRRPEQLGLLSDQVNGARFSDCRQFRYLLWRSWDAERPVLTWIMLNPSLADESRPDRTLLSCCKRSEALGFGGLRIANLCAWVSPYPKQLMKVADPSGPENDHYLRDAILTADALIVAWGKLPTPLAHRAEHVLALIENSGKIALTLRRNADGSPAHPLRLALNLRPFPLLNPHQRPP